MGSATPSSMRYTLRDEIEVPSAREKSPSLSFGPGQARPFHGTRFAGNIEDKNVLTLARH